MERLAIHSLIISVGAGLAALSFSAETSDFRIDQDNSILAVVVHKGGIGASLAHDHFIAADGYEYELTMEGADLETAAFTMNLPVAELVVDDPDLKKRWDESIQGRRILTGPFSAISAKNRGKIRKHMLDKSQLAEASHPEITIKVKKIHIEEPAEALDLPHRITIAFSLRGKTVEREMPAQLTLADDSLTVEAVGEFTFSEFGIKPYSALLGAIRNQDTFHLYANVTAKRALARENE